MRHALHLPLAVMLAAAVLPKGAHARTVTVSSDYGYDAADATRFVQAALDDATADTVLLDAAPGTWRTDGLLVRRSDFTLLFESGTVLEAIPGVLDTFQSLLTLRACTNVVVDGRGGTIQQEKTDYDRSSQFRHGILTRGATGCTIRNLTIRRCAGDGIEVSSDFVETSPGVFEPLVPSRDIVIDEVTCDENNRQGISVIDVVGLRITDSRFTNTQGTEPESGIDFEPFRTYHRMQDIVITDCVFAGNHGNGIQYGGIDVDQSTPPCDILIERCEIYGNGQNPDRFRAGVDVNNFNKDNFESSRGTFTLRNAVIRDEEAQGINVRQYANGLDVLFEDVLVDNVANDPQNRLAGPITIQPRSYDANTSGEPCFGNVEFRNVRVVDDLETFNGETRTQVTISQTRTDLAGPTDITGDICVETPFEFSVFEAPEPCANVTVDITACSAPVPLELTSFSGACVDGAHELSWSIADASALRGFTVEVSVTGDGGWSGAADVETLPSYRSAAFAKTLPTGGTSSSTPPSRTGSYYRLVSHFADGTAELSPVVFVADCSGGQQLGGGLKVFPNPTSGTVNFEAAAVHRTWTIADAAGRVVRRVSVPVARTELRIDGLAAGYYTIFEDGTGRHVRLVIE